MRGDSDRVLEEGRDDQEAADGGKEAAAGQWSAGVLSSGEAGVSLREASRSASGDRGRRWRDRDGVKLGGDIRLDGPADAIQHVLDLARLLPDGIERRRLLDRGGRPELGAGPKAVAARTPSCHVDGMMNWSRKGGSRKTQKRKARVGVEVVFCCRLREAKGRQTGWNRGGRRVLPGQVLFSNTGRWGGQKGWKSDGAVSPGGKKRPNGRLNCKRRRSRRDENGVQKEELGKTGFRRDGLWPRDGKLVDWLGWPRRRSWS